MEIRRTISEVITDDGGKSLTEGNVILYRQKSGVDQIAIYHTYYNGLLAMSRLSDGEKYSVRPASIVYCRRVSNPMPTES